MGGGTGPLQPFTEEGCRLFHQRGKPVSGIAIMGGEGELLPRAKKGGRERSDSSLVLRGEAETEGGEEERMGREKRDRK